MKAFEETWEVDWGDKWCEERDTVQGIHVKGTGYADVVHTDSGVYGPTRERAKLIAQAPAMARLLLEMFSASEDTDGVGQWDARLETILKAAGALP